MSRDRATYRRRELSIKWVVREVVRPSEAYSSGASVRGPPDAFAYLRPWCREPQETAVVLLLDSRMRVMGHRQVGVGSLTQAPLSVRVVMQAVLLSGAAAFILAHNHPSGDPKPSEEDITVTKKLAEVSRELEVPLLDHLILVCQADGTDTFLSLKEAGML